MEFYLLIGKASTKTIAELNRQTLREAAARAALVPIWSAEARLVGWFDGRYLFSRAMDWIAFVRDHSVFSRANTWLGCLEAGSFLDRKGKVVAWLAGASPRTSVRPLRPVPGVLPVAPIRPILPVSPLPPKRPLTPLSGWSRLTWPDWLAQ